MSDEAYRKRLLLAAEDSRRFSKHTLMNLCICWTFNDQTGELKVTPRSGASIEFLKENIGQAGILISRLPENECAFGRLKR